MTGHPKFAIVKLRPADDVFALFRLLLQHGYPEVSFVNELHDETFLATHIIDNPIRDDHYRLSNGQLASCNESSCSVLNSNTVNDSEVIQNEPPPSSPSSTMNQLRQRGSRAHTDDPSVYAHCQLCQNRIMASRLSNLTNHVRRHASLKQFQCCYCEYTHNEMAKVRLHMLHNHKDRDSQPIDNISPDMQAQWDFLMKQCFPQYNKEFFTKDGPISQVAIPTVTSTLNNLHQNEETVDVKCGESLSRFTCIECGEEVDEFQLQHHLHQCHASDCVPYVCDECGYSNGMEWKVRLHISIKHAEKAADIAVSTKSTVDNYAQFVCKFFPDFDKSKNGADEDDDKELLASLKMQMNNNDETEPVLESNHTGFRCELCQKRMIPNRPMSSLLSHAKRHYHIKQFQCRQCMYSSSEAAHVRSHMKLRHEIVDQIPKDNKDSNLQAAWMQMVIRCFPKAGAKMGKFKFKNFRTVKIENVGNSNEGTVKCRLCCKSVTRTQLLDHASSHVPSKPFACSLCHFRTGEYQHLRVHLLKHKSLGERCRIGSNSINSMGTRNDPDALRCQYVRYCFGVQSTDI